TNQPLVSSTRTTDDYEQLIIDPPSFPPSNSEEPQLYAVATPHPTLQYIYPVYAAPMDLSNMPEKKGRSSPLTWRSEKSRAKKEIQIVTEHQQRFPVPVQMGEEPVNEDGTWYHFPGTVDYIRPGTTLPQVYAEGGVPIQGMEEAMEEQASMAGTAYEESYYSYPATPQYQGYLHPQPQRMVPSEVYSAVPSNHYPRARSVSPVQTRAITPVNVKPRRATTPTPRRSRTPNYEPAPPVPQTIVPVPHRSTTPHSKSRPQASLTPSPIPDAREYRTEPRGSRERTPHDNRQLRVDFSVPTSGRTSRTSRRPSADEDATAISSSVPHESTLTNYKSSNHLRPYSPTSSPNVSQHASRSNYKHYKNYPSSTCA
ncbi:12848_t:CDS:2, partial [Acaulospora colombiana]